MDAKSEVRVGVRELRGNLSRYLRLASSGATVLVMFCETVVAEIKAPAPQRLAPRRRGGLKGRIWMADDVDTLPDEMLDAMEAWKF